MAKLLVGILILSGIAWAEDAKSVLDGDKLARGFDMGLDSGEQKRDWIKKDDGGFRLSYPAKQGWGAVFFTIGAPAKRPRPGMDFSAYKTLVVEMRGAGGGERVAIGIKSNTQADDGSEVKLEETLTSEWKAYRFSLARFRGADLRNLFVAAEVVFDGDQPRTVFVRAIKYVP